MDSIIVQMVTTGAQNAPASSGTQSSRAQSAGGSEFGDMVRQKQQQQSQQDTKSQDTAKNQDSGSTDQNAQDTQEANAARESTEVGTEQYVIAAALMLQPGVQFLQVFTRQEDGPVRADTRRTVEKVETAEAAPEVPQEHEEAAPERVEAVREVFEAPEETFETVVERTVERTEVVEEVVEEENTEETVEVTEAVVQEPVFRNVEAAPVKVAEPTTEEPVDLTRSGDVERMAAKIETLIVGEKGESKVEFTLIPASLGKVTVEIVRTLDGALHIQFSASSQRAADLLGRNLDNLRYHLGIQNRPAVELDVRQMEEGVRQLLNPDGQQQQQQREQQQRRRRQREAENGAHDFLQQLRLGLVGVQGV